MWSKTEIVYMDKDELNDYLTIEGAFVPEAFKHKDKNLVEIEITIKKI